MKLSITIDVDQQLIMNYKVRKKLRHDNQDFKYLLKGLNMKQVVADKGYDDKKLRRFVINKLKAIIKRQGEGYILINILPLYAN